VEKLEPYNVHRNTALTLYTFTFTQYHSRVYIISNDTFKTRPRNERVSMNPSIRSKFKIFKLIRFVYNSMICVHTLLESILILNIVNSL